MSIRFKRSRLPTFFFREPSLVFEVVFFPEGSQDGTDFGGKKPSSWLAEPPQTGVKGSQAVELRNDRNEVRNAQPMPGG